MPLLRQQPAALVMAVIGTAVLLPALGYMQYRWIGEVGQAARQQIHADLDRAADSFRSDFDEEMRRTFQPGQLQPGFGRGGPPPPLSSPAAALGEVYVAARPSASPCSTSTAKHANSSESTGHPISFPSSKPLKPANQFRAIPPSKWISYPPDHLPAAASPNPTPPGRPRAGASPCWISTKSASSSSPNS